ncbi:MAG: phosphoenolpyruvate carboxykinase, partial [Verrucomicrobiota bacterium]|nr:phosphoenolpyruvate carboxykinase [Verrucomicrobiota bacterium]
MNISQYQTWIDEIVALCKPSRVHLCDGSEEEYDRIAALMVKQHTLIPLKKRPSSFWCHSDPDDVARVEECTFICSEQKIDAGPTNNWCAPREMHERLKTLFSGCMQGRTMYVVPYCMGPIGSPYSKIGIEITDS